MARWPIGRLPCGMSSNVPSREVAVWFALALALGLAVGAVDLSARAAQGPVLLIMVAAFAVTLPGRAPMWLAGVGAGLGIPLAHAFGSGAWSGGTLVAIVPALIGAAGGAWAGRLLDTAGREV